MLSNNLLTSSKPGESLLCQNLLQHSAVRPVTYQLGLPFDFFANYTLDVIKIVFVVSIHSVN